MTLVAPSSHESHDIINLALRFVFMWPVSWKIAAMQTIARTTLMIHTKKRKESTVDAISISLAKDEQRNGKRKERSKERTAY